MTVHETPLTVGYWQALGEGTLYEEFPVVKAQRGVQERRVVDGLVVLGTPPCRVPEGPAGRSTRNCSVEGVEVVSSCDGEPGQYLADQTHRSMRKRKSKAYSLLNCQPPNRTSVCRSDVCRIAAGTRNGPAGSRPPCPEGR